MIRKRFGIIYFFMSLLSSLSFAADEGIQEAKGTWDDYKIITERNIFSRYRTGAVSTPRLRQNVVATEQSYYTLRGITRQLDGYVSFIEDSRTANVTRFKKGDAIGEGEITSHTLDYITYECDGQAIKVEIGMNLEGQVSNYGRQYYSTAQDDSQGNSGFPGMGQMPDMVAQAGDQTQGRGAQGPGMGRFQSSGQTTATGQPAVTEQSQSSRQASTTVQSSQTTTQSFTGAGQDETSEEILERLKERRKKELE